MQRALRARNVALATLAVVAATYGGAVAIWTQLPVNEPGGAVAHPAATTSMAGMKMMPGMKMPAPSR